MRVLFLTLCTFFFTIARVEAGMMMMGGDGMMAVGVASSACPGADDVECSRDGSSNFNLKTLSISDGRITGTIVTNQCAPHEYGGIDPRSHTSECTEITFPVPNYVSDLPLPTPLRGPIAFTVSGVNVYGPYEAGLTCDTGTCPSGVDLPICSAVLSHSCPTTFPGELLDSCKGHAQPYHYHLDMKCNYNSSASSSHSPLLAVAFDGRGMYGQWEGSGVHPTLDSCGGHFGDVPAYSENGVVVIPAQTNVYHYHTSEEPPYTLGCYGPVTDIATCQGLYSTCNDGTISLQVNSGTYDYDTDCPCFHDQSGAQYNLGLFQAISGTTAPPPTTAAPTSAATLECPSVVNIMALSALLVKWNFPFSEFLALYEHCK